MPCGVHLLGMTPQGMCSMTSKAHPKTSLPVFALSIFGLRVLLSGIADLPFHILQALLGTVKVGSQVLFFSTILPLAQEKIYPEFQLAQNTVCHGSLS